MATPIQYVPQFIPTNVGLMNQQLGQMQQRYDQAFSDIGQFEDQYAQLPVHPTDIEGKNAILGKFQADTKNIVDRYNGDYGAAAKDIARQLSKARQDPFFQLATDKRMLAEEQRKREAMLGPNAITTRSVSDIKAYDPVTGRYANPEDLGYQVYDRNMIIEDWKHQYAGRKDKTREFDVKGGLPGYFRKRMYKGLKESEIPGVTQESFDYLKSRYGDVPDEQLADIASNMSAQLIGGWQDQDIADRNYTGDGSGDAPITPSKPTYAYVPGLESTDESKSSTAGQISAIRDLQQRIATANSRNQKYTNASNIPGQDIGNLLYSKEVSEAKQGITNTINNLKKNVPYYNYLESKGLNQDEILNELAKNSDITTGRFSQEILPSTDPTVNRDFANGIKRYFTQGRLSAAEFPVLVEEDGRIVEHDPWGNNPSISDVLNTKELSLNDVRLDPKRKQFVLNADKGGSTINYRMPFKTIENEGVRNSLNSYSATTDAFSGASGPGTFLIVGDKNGNWTAKQYSKSLVDDIKSGKYKFDGVTVENDFDDRINPATGERVGFVQNLYTRDANGNMVETSIDDYTSNAMKSVIDYFQLAPEPTKSQGTKTYTR